MPYSIRSHDNLGCICIKWSGAFSAAEGAAYYREIADHEDYRRGASLFHDVRLVDADVPSTEIRKVALGGPRDASPSGVRKIAVLAPADLTFGMMRMLAAMRERPGLELSVFRDLEDAKAWLELPADLGDPFQDMDPAG